eukprot:TRINITY_DN2110_c0_g1_i1.p1 TRINITY_DN2110_c0_g1~~TRINITY_DN2110_c0_g1_i1.p1  ORF type:complete len:143 (+),score=33.60 TRINITY_DN2110_c0_g1_i1:475-903(+)
MEISNILLEDIEKRSKTRPRTRKSSAIDDSLYTPPSKRQKTKSKSLGKVSDGNGINFQDLRKEHKRHRKLLREQFDYMFHVLQSQNSKIETMQSSVLDFIKELGTGQELMANLQDGSNQEIVETLESDSVISDSTNSPDTSE